MLSSANVYQNIVLLCIGLMLVAWLSHRLVERVISKDTLQKFYATSSVIFQVLGSIAGIMQAFVVVSFWNDFQDASNSAHQEVENITVTYRNISLLEDSAEKTLLVSAFKNYVVSLVTEEIAGHAQGLSHNDSTQAKLEVFWRSLHALGPTVQTLGQQVVFQAILTDANNSSKLRQHRLSVMRSGDTTLLWVVLIGSAFLVMAVMGTLSMGNKGRVYFLQSFALAFIFALMIAVSLDYSKPYEGTTTISQSVYDDILRYAKLVH